MNPSPFPMLSKIYTFEVRTYLFSLFVFLVLIPNFVFGFYGNDKVVIDQILLEQELQEQKLDYIQDSETVSEQAVINLLSALEIKKEVADEKELAYEKAINQITCLVVVFGIISIIILTGLGLFHNKQLVTKKEELDKLFSERSAWFQNSVEKEILTMKTRSKNFVKEEILEMQEDNRKKFDSLSFGIKADMENLSKRLLFKEKQPNLDKSVVFVGDEEDVEIDDGIQLTFK